MKIMFLLVICGLSILASASALADGDSYNGPTTSSTSSASSSADSSAKEGSAPKSQNANDIQTAANTLSSSAPKCSGLKGFKSLQAFSSTYDKCSTLEGTATNMCLESLSPSIAKALPLVQAALSGLSSSVTDACSSAGKAFEAANAGLAAFQATCSAAKGACNAYCGSAVSDLESGQKDVEKCVDQQIEICGNTAGGCDPTWLSKVQKEKSALLEKIKMELDKSNKSVTAGRNNTCSGYASQIASALTGAIGMLNSSSQANNCNTNSNINALATPLDCSTEPNKSSNQTCICQAAPRTPGCNNGLDTNLNANSSMMGSSDLGSYTPGSTGAGSSGIDGMTDTPFAGGSGGASTSSAPGAPSGGGAGIDGGGGFGGGNGDGHGKAGSSLNTNILAGEGGGGGGSGGWGGSGSSDSEGLRKYLPGGERDPAAVQGKGQASSLGISGAGGKSNWEKVRDRYRDNNPTLLGY